MKPQKIFALLLIAGILSIITLNSVMAHCPLCTTGAAVGVGFARAYGVDDSIVGVLLGGLIASSALWFNNWLKKKGKNFLLSETLMVIVSFLLIVVPFYTAGLITDIPMVKSMPTHHGMTGFGIFGLAQFGIDKLLFGMILGTLGIWGTFALSDRIKKINGKVLFPFQGMVFMIIALAVLSAVCWMAAK